MTIPWSLIAAAMTAAFGAGLSLSYGVSNAAAPPTPASSAPSPLPQVRVMQAMHNGPINQIRADARFERLVTTSGDKTLRIWRISDLQPLRTVALPADPGPEGTPYSVAMSSDGRRIYVAGYTGWEWHRGAHIYVIDAVSGRIVGTIGRFVGDVVTALDLSPDGRRLAVGLGRGGLSVIDATTGKRVRRDPKYAAPVTFVHHAANGRLATSSADGCLRVYAVHGKLIYRRQFPPRPAEQRQCTGGQLGGVRFSPDGRWLALGNQVAPELGLFDARSLSLVRTLRVNRAGQTSLCCVAWSHDSETLFANGSVDGDAATPLYRFRDAGRGAQDRLDVGRQQFTNMLPMADGSLVFATTVPSLTKLTPEGRIALRSDGQAVTATPDNIDFHRTRNSPDRFEVSSDGSSIAFEVAAGRWLRASPLQLDVGTAVVASYQDPGMNPARRSGAVAVQTATDFFSHRQPTLINGLRMQLGFEEGVRSWAVHSRLPIVALGTQFRLHLLDANARPMPGWESPPFLAAPAWHTVITEDGRWVVVAVGDGTVHWYEVASGRERLGVFVHANAVDWVAWRPDGYYSSSPQGDRFVGWLVNRGEAESPDFFRAVQFERELYRPSLVRQALSDGASPELSGQRLAGVLSALAPPRVRIESIDATSEAGKIAVRFTAESTGRPISELGVYVDGLPVLRAAERKVLGAEASSLTRTVTVPVVAGAIRVEAESARALGLDESLPLSWQSSGKLRGPGTLWVVAIGVGRFESASGVLRALPFATNDASELAKAFAVQKGKAFADTRIVVLTDSSKTPALQPTKANILAQLRELEQMNPEDTVVVFLASHGLTDAAEYYFVTQDASASEVRKLIAAQAAGTRLPEGALPSLLSGTEVMAVLRRLPGRRVLILDTCHAAALGNSDPYSLIKRSASAELAVVSAARGDQSSYDATDQPHGIFTLAMIRALTNPALAPRGRVTLRGAFDSALPQVEAMLRQLRERTRDPVRRAAIQQTPVISAPGVLESSVLGMR